MNKEENFDSILDIWLWNTVAAVEIDTESEFVRDRGVKLIKEEFQELLTAIEDGDKAEELDALIDLIWVIVGHARSRGFSLPEGLKRVSAANWSKFIENCSDDWKDDQIEYIEEKKNQKGVYAIENVGFTVFKNQDTKIVKPSSFKEPLLSDLV